MVFSVQCSGAAVPLLKMYWISVSQRFKDMQRRCIGLSFLNPDKAGNP
jgi:hypothetical protein